MMKTFTLRALLLLA